MSMSQLSKLVKKPDRFNGDKDKWRDFKSDFTNMMVGASAEYLEEMRQAEAREEAANDSQSDELRQRSIMLHSILSSYTCDGAKTIGLELADSHNGFEFWRRLCQDQEPRSNMRKLALARKIDRAACLESRNEQQFGPALRIWEQDIVVYDKLPGLNGSVTKFDDNMKMAIVLEKAPTGIVSFL